MRGGDHPDRRLQRTECLLRHSCRNVRGDRAARIGLVHADQPARLLDAFDHRIHVDGRQCAQVDDLAVDAFLRKRIGRVDRTVDGLAVGHDGRVFAVSHDVRLAGPG